MKNPSLSELRQEQERERKRMPRWQRWSLWGAVFFAVWCAAGFFAVPPLVRGQLEKRLSEQMHRRVTVGKVSLNPLSLSVVIESFEVAEPAGGNFIGWRRLFVNFDSFSFLLREWRFQEIALDGFSCNVAVAKDGQLNFADLLAQFGVNKAAPAAPKSEKKPWPLLVRRLAVGGAQFAYSDASRTEPFTTVVGPMSFSLLNFHTGGLRNAPGEFAATTESGETFAWKGGVSLAPLRSSGNLVVGKIALRKYAPFYADRVKFVLNDGRLDGAVDYEFEIKDGKPLLRVANGRILLESLKIAKRAAGEPVIALDKVELTGLAATWPKISADVARVAVTGGSVMVQRTAEGIDLVDLLMPVVDAAPPAVTAGRAVAPVPAVEPIEANVAEISVRDLAITVEDRSTPRLARHELTELTCDVRGFSLANPAAAMPFGLNVKLAPEGSVHAAGTLTLAPFKADLAVEVNSISLANISPYAESFLNMRIGKGRLTTALNLKLELPVGSVPVVAAQGEVSVDEFAAYPATSLDEIAGWNSLAIKGIEYSSSPAKLMISEVTWVEPSGRFIVNADGTTNIALASKPAGAVEIVYKEVKLPGSPVKKQETEDSIFIALDRFVLEKAALSYDDRSVQPNVHVSLDELSGQIEGLASSELARATVTLKGKVDGVAPVFVTGKVNPLSAQAFTDLKVTMKAIELVPVGPYVGKFAGYELARGSLNVDVKCKVAQRKVDWTNVVTIDQFTFGNATNSPDATKLPVRLAVALLKDTAGKIVLDVPVQGSLDDPEIRSGRVIWRVVTNILVKAATAPFSLLGSLFGGEKDQDLSFMQFAVGETDPVNEVETRKLDVVARAMLGRPGLNLELVGGYDEVADGPALREITLENQMRNIIWADRRMAEPELTLEQVQIDPVQKMGMVRRLYYRTNPSEKPRHAVFSGGEPSGPVPGSRGNLGAFKRSETTISKSRPVAKRVPLPDKDADPSVPPENATVELKTKATLTPEEMKVRLLEEMKPDEEVYRKLALERATAVRQYLVNQGQVPVERISLADITAEAPAAKGARVELRLK